MTLDASALWAIGIQCVLSSHDLNLAILVWVFALAHTPLSITICSGNMLNILFVAFKIDLDLW
jgi:hypothetical protein